MATSLEDLLADEGFKGRKSRTITRASTGIVSKRIPPYSPRDEHKRGLRLRKTERAYSDANRYDLSVESPLTDRVKGRRSLDVFKREKIVKRSTNGTNERHIRSRSQEIHVDIETSIETSKPTSVGELALDELAIKAIMFMLNVHTKRFIKDRDFRTSLHHSCLDLLNSTDLNDEVKVITNLEQAIDSVERATEEQVDPKSLKKAALQLSVITGLNENELKDGTSRISNSVLSACAHIYLSVIYCLQKKERVAARHLLQVFIDSPFSARTTLVPELWYNILHPHLLHLDDWYSQEVDFLPDDASKPRRLKKLKKLYDEVLDTGTHKLALYYKDWLTDGMEAPTIPAIDVPSVSFQGVQQGGSLGHGSLDFSTPTNAFTPQHLDTKNINDSGVKHESVVDDVEVHRTVQKSDDGSLVEDKMTVIHSLDEKEYKDLHIKQYGEVHHEALGAQETMELLRANALGKYRNAILQQGVKGTNILQTLSVSEVNELSLKMLVKSVFQQNERSTCLLHLNNAHPQIETRPISGERERYFCDIPRDYICPLTGLLFKDPVTLETGQTYERVAIAEWFSDGNKSCPVTSEILEYNKIPRTNFILCRVIDRWKAEYSRNILALACQLEGSPWEQKSKDEEAIFILEKLFTLVGEGEDKRIGKQLIAFGGLQFLIKRFEYGDMDEKTCVAALLLGCIKADSGCRINVTRSIDKTCLLELLHSKETKSIANAVLLLFELICLNRRKDVQFFLNDGLQKESIMSSMHILLVFLRDCPPEKKPLIAVLLLHLDLMTDQQKCSIYREQAADSITSTMNTSFVDDNIRVTCCRALLILGGRISFSGKVMTEDWILKKAGFLDGPELEAQEDEVTVKDYILKESEEEGVAVNDWLMKVSAFLLSDRKTSFLHLLSRCLKSGHRDMTRVSLTTMAWLSSTLAFLPYYKSRVSVFSVVINQLKENLKDGESVEHRILAAMSLLNFSKIPECKELLMTIADEIIVPLKDLCEATWMAKELYALICQKKHR